ncbi:hypothetical protein CC79DRAFT_1275537 [Sarocladium strictum]
MQTLRLKPREPVDDDIENWDDDDFLVDGDDLDFRRVSTATSATNGPSARRDSTSSHLSLRSELESWNGEDEQQYHLPGDDEESTMDAIAAAQTAGIPLPSNVPSSALMGGTIKRLGGRKIRKIIQEDWENDLELPDVSQGLQIKTQDQGKFPESLRQVSAGSSTHGSPVKTMKSPVLIQDDRRTSAQSATSALTSAINLDKFKDDEDDDDFFGDGGGTIKPQKKRLVQPVSFITPPTPQKVEKTKTVAPTEDDFENDLELPSDGKLKLSTRRDIPKTPSSQSDDLDWGEGSLGTRYGGTWRDGRSKRSSSASALSPSVSSTLTAESEDETFDGLVLPSGPVNFRERLQQRRPSKSPERRMEPTSEPKKSPPAEADRPDFLEGLDIGDGEAFDAGKLTLHRNIKVKETRPASPARPKTAVSLTFTNKTSANTRIPRLSHERSHSTSLEPVSESGGPIVQRVRRPASRLGHSATSSITSIPTPTTPSSTSSFGPSTPRRREIGTKTSTTSLRNEPTTTSAQLLKQKRSLPAIRALNPPTKPFQRTTRPGSSGRPNSSGRPGSSGDADRPPSALRPRTPVERQRSTAIGESPFGKRSTFTPAGVSTSSQPRTLRHFRRHDSDNSIDLRPNSRAYSRSTVRSPSPGKPRVAADTWERLSKPRTRKQFGDGHELDAFDDLPTSRENETRFLRQPLTSGPKAALRNKLYQNVLPDRTNTPTPSTPASPAKSGYTPHFARDTAASRRARETSLANRPPTTGPLAQVTAQRNVQMSSRANLATPPPQLPLGSIRSRKSGKRPPQLKPHLISNLNAGKESKVVNGMFYNADTFRWEGNENVLNVFDAAASTPSTASVPAHIAAQNKEVQTPRPALITNISATKGVQVVGGMVFDPQAMCWLKLGPQSNAGTSDMSDPLDGFNAFDDEEDVFKDIPDLDDAAGTHEEGGSGRVSDIKDEWLVGEEFDVGPEFVRRQREEEDRWRKKCEKWTSRTPRDREAWRWTIRELVSQFDDLATM